MAQFRPLEQLVSLPVLVFFLSSFLVCAQAKADTETEGHKEVEVLSSLFDEIEAQDPKKAVGIALHMLDVAENESPEDINFALNLVSYAYMQVEKWDSALYYSHKTIEKAKAESDSIYLAKAYNNKGVVYFNTNNFEKGFEYFLKSAQIEREVGDIEGAIDSYTNLGAISLALGKVDSAQFYSEIALELAESTGDKAKIAVAYTNLGNILINSNLEEAKDYYFLAIEIYESLKMYKNVALTYQNLATAFRIQGQYTMSITYDMEGMKYAKAHGSPEMISNGYYGLAVAFEAQKSYIKALKNYKLYSDWRDTMYVRSNQQAVIDMQEKYNSAQTEAENESLKQKNQISKLENEKSKEELANSRIMAWSSIGGVLLLIGLAYSLYNRNKLKAKANAELQQANDIIQEKNQDITSSLEYASKIQEALLPTKENTSLFKDSLFLLLPKDIVSGDFFWYTEKKGQKIFTAVDCTGHGVPGAFMSMIGNTFLHEIINERGITEPAEILNQLRAKVILALSSRDARKDGMDMAICSLDEKNMILQYAGANNPLYLVRNNEVLEYRPDKQPVGYMPERDGPFTNHRIEVKPGDKAYVFSDGYADQFGGPKGKKFKYKQLRELLVEISDKPMAEQKQILNERFVEWKGDIEQIDDVCLVGVTI